MNTPILDALVEAIEASSGLPVPTSREYAARIVEQLDARGFEIIAHAREDVPALLDAFESAVALIRDLVDADDCWFDHHGGCQAHGYLSLEPGELCPHAEAKALISQYSVDTGSSA